MVSTVLGGEYDVVFNMCCLSMISIVCGGNVMVFVIQQLLTKQPSTPETVLTMERQHILQKPLHSHQKLYCLRKNIQKKERNRQNVKKLTIQTLSKVNQHNLDTLYMKSVSYFMIVEKLLTFVLYINLIYFGKLHGIVTLKGLI
jgi:hypothetical protein